MSHRHRLQAVAALAGVIAVAFVLAGTDSALSAPSERARAATAPGKNGMIAFRRYLDGGRSTAAIYTIAFSGKSESKLTRPGRGVEDDQPDWAPDGSLLVFDRCAPNVPCAIYTVKPDGSDLRRFSPPCSASGPVETRCEDGEGASFLLDGKQVDVIGLCPDR